MPVYEDTEPASLIQRPIGENPQPVSLNEQVFTACQIAKESDLNEFKVNSSSSVACVKKKKKKNL